jgi:hypothetical protein
MHRSLFGRRINGDERDFAAACSALSESTHLDGILCALLGATSEQAREVWCDYFVSFHENNTPDKCSYKPS